MLRIQDTRAANNELSNCEAICTEHDPSELATCFREMNPPTRTWSREGRSDPQAQCQQALGANAKAKIPAVHDADSSTRMFRQWWKLGAAFVSAAWRIADWATCRNGVIATGLFPSFLVYSTTCTNLRTCRVCFFPLLNV